MNKEDFKSLIEARVKMCINLSGDLLTTGHFYLGGGCLTGKINDIDVYPVSNQEFKIPKIGQVISNTKNAVTFKEGVPVQFCKYYKNSLEELVRSFDFSHIQIGVYIVNAQVREIFWTDVFETAKICGTSQYISSDYPLSSLFRLLKYHKREELTKHFAVKAIINIVHDVVRRGFKTYTDFKDQLDAVDLGIVPEELNELEYKELRELFEYLKRINND